MSRPRSAVLGLALLLTLPTTGQAQLGGLIKKAKDKVVPGADQSQPARLPGPEITADVVDHVLLGLKAEKDARDRAAAAQAARERKANEDQMDPQARYNTCLGEKQQSDPKYPELQKQAKDAQAAADKGEMSKVVEISNQIQSLTLELQQRAETACASLKPGAAPAPAQPPTADQLAIQNAPTGTAEEAGAKAAGMTPLTYGQAKELIYTHLNYGKRSGVSDEEKRVIEAKRTELKQAFAAIGLP
jgi:hypothetical protein